MNMELQFATMNKIVVENLEGDLFQSLSCFLKMQNATH
jgi:hypothetical protein